MVVGKSKARTTRIADAEAGKLVMRLPPDAERGIRPFLNVSQTSLLLAAGRDLVVSGVDF